MHAMASQYLLPLCCNPLHTNLRPTNGRGRGRACVRASSMRARGPTREGTWNRLLTLWGEIYWQSSRSHGHRGLFNGYFEGLSCLWWCSLFLGLFWERGRVRRGEGGGHGGREIAVPKAKVDNRKPCWIGPASVRPRIFVLRLFGQLSRRLFASERPLCLSSLSLPGIYASCFSDHDY